MDEGTTQNIYSKQVLQDVADCILEHTQPWTWCKDQVQGCTCDICPSCLDREFVIGWAKDILKETTGDRNK